MAISPEATRRLLLVVRRLDETPTLSRRARLAEVVEADLELHRALLNEQWDDLLAALAAHGAECHALALLELTTEVGRRRAPA